MQKKNSFTLIELLTVIAIIAILAGLLLPAVNGARNKARGTQCVSNLKNVGVAFISYADDYKGFYPLAATLDSSNNLQSGWSYAIYKYIGLEKDCTQATINKSVLNCPSGLFDSSTFKSNASSAYTANPLITDVNNGYVPGVDGAGDGTPTKVIKSLKNTRVTKGSSAFLVCDANCECSGTTGAPLTVYGVSRDSSTHKATIASDCAKYLQTSNDDTSWIHSDSINLVFADGHCGSIRKEAGLTGDDCDPY